MDSSGLHRASQRLLRAESGETCSHCSFDEHGAYTAEHARRAPLDQGGHLRAATFWVEMHQRALSVDGT